VQPLSGLRLVEVTDSIAGAFCGKLLASYGAEVARMRGPDDGVFRDQLRLPNGSAAFFDYLNAGKRDGGPLGDLPRRLDEAPHLLVADLARFGQWIDKDQLLAGYPDLRIVSVSAWGLQEPGRDWPASDIALHAQGGWMFATGEPGKAPVQPAVSCGQYMAGTYAAIAALWLARGGPNRFADVSVHEAIAATNIYDSVTLSCFGILRNRAAPKFADSQVVILTAPVQDGYIGLHMVTPQQWRSLCTLMGRPELFDDPRFKDAVQRATNVAEIDAILLPWLAKQKRLELYHAAQAMRIPVALIPTVDEVLASPHLAARDFWQTLESEGRQFIVPGLPVRMHSEGEGQQDAAPADEHEHPLKVLDLSMGWAGPHVSNILGDLGADVIKVESCSHPDWWRGFAARNREPGEVTLELSPVFNAANRNKRGLTLELSHTRGREVLLRLAAEADVLVENFTARVMPSLGLSYEQLAAVNPRLIMVSLPAFGSFGPEADYVGYGPTIEAMSGLTALTGYSDGPPIMLANALGDPYSGTTGALAVLLGLHERDRTGTGQHIEVAQLEAFLPQLAESILEYQATGRLPARPGNGAPGLLQGVYRCAGEDEWLAVTCRPEQEDALRGVTGGRDLAEWAAALSTAEATAALRAAGIAAAVVHSAATLLTDEQLLARDFWLPIDRAHVGFHLYPPAIPFLPDAQPRGDSRPAPTLGEHNREVLREAGLSDAEIDDLAEAGVTGTEPLPVTIKTQGAVS
jgi:crotonobetainyl-CoA:carnitine CoA-transferase CaiB-like acyl-CoA transferase